MIVTDSDNIVRWINGNRSNLPICNYFINQLKHFRQNSQIEIHFKVVKAHAQTYYNNYVDQLTREVIYKEKADNHLCYQLMNDDQFLRDFLSNHPSAFTALQTETFHFYRAKELNTQAINWVPAEQAVVMIGDLPNTYGTYLMLLYNQGSRLKQMVGKIHSRNLFVKNWMFGKEKVWQNVKNERDGSRKANESRQYRFGGFRTSLASRRSSFVLEPDYAGITKRLQLMSQSLLNT